MKVKQLSFRHNDQQPRRRQTASSMWGRFIGTPPGPFASPIHEFPWPTLRAVAPKREEEKACLFFFLFLFFSLNHHLLLEHRLANDEGEKGLRKSYFSPLPCVVQCIQSRGLSSFTEKEEWADLTWAAAPLREGESDFQSKCELFWCPCVWTYKQDKWPVSRHLHSKSPRADNWCDRQFSLTPCQQNSSWAAHSSPHSIKAWTYHKKHGKDLLVVNSNNANKNSNQLSPHTDVYDETEVCEKTSARVKLWHELVPNVVVSATTQAELL